MPDDARPLSDPRLLGLSDAGDGGWELTVEPHLCGRTGFLHGGCSLAAATITMEQATGRPLIWATAQYVARAAVAETVRYAVTINSAGNRMSQVRAEATVGDRSVAWFLGAFGHRDTPTEHRWGAAPAVAPPEECPVYELTSEPEGSFHRTVSLRVAALDRDAGTAALWARLPDGMGGTAAGLAMLGDYVPAGFRLTLQENTTPAASLDNTIRIVRPEPSPWILLDIRLGALADGAAHGDLRAWSASGRLVATASQSFLFNL